MKIQGKNEKGERKAEEKALKMHLLGYKLQEFSRFAVATLFTGRKNESQRRGKDEGMIKM